MTEEIKEILIKDVNEILVKEFCTDWKEKRLYIELLVNSTPFSNLLNYITNLQKENENLKEELKYTIPQVEHNQIVSKLCREKQDYKQRNEKAIEWCKCVVNAKYTSDKLPNGKITDMGYCLDLAEPLLNILQGGDE